MKKKTKMLALFLASICFLYGCRKQEYLEIYQEETDALETFLETEKETDQDRIFVDVRGAVAVPGVYELLPGARVFEAIEKSGGLCPEADERRVNQAARLSDGEQLYIPVRGEETTAVSEREEDGLININTATVKELTSLPGIGEARAEDVIAYREEHGGFSSIEEMKEISGIKDAVFEKIKDKIKVQ